MSRKITTALSAILLITAGTVLLTTSGCKTPPTENVSERPWNEPKGFQFFGSGDRRR